MGCTQSTQVVEAKKKIDPVEATSKLIPQDEQQKPQIFKQIPERGDCFLIGSLNQKQQIFANVKLETMSINKMSMPSGGFICNNFPSILEIQKGKYFISGGINHDLTQISSNCFYYYSNEHRVQPLSPMIQARYTHSTLHYPLKNAIYIIGGRYYGDDSQAILPHCEKFDIESGKCIKLPQMNVKRCTCFVFTWKDTIYTFGGYTGPFERSTLIEYLDTNEKEWKLLDVQLNRGLQGAILLPTDHNEITIFGGLCNSGPTDSVVTINLEEKSIRSKRKLAEKRSLYKSFYKKGKVYLFGGDDNFTCEVYDIAKQTSEIVKKQFGFQIEQFDSLGFSASSVHVPYKEIVQPQKPIGSGENDQVIYIVGTTEEPFLCELNISIPTARFVNVPLNLKLYAHQGGVFINSHQLLFFGGIEDDSLSVINADTFLYDINSKTAKKVAKMNQNRYAFTYQSFSNNPKDIDTIFCFGGATADTQGKLVFLNTCQKFTVKNQKWQLIAPCPQKLISPMSLTFKEDIFLFGGTNKKNEKSRGIYTYSKNSDTWSQLQVKMMFGIEAASISRVSDHEFYIFGGLLENGPSQNIWSLYIKEPSSQKKNETLCVFQEKGHMNEKKAQHTTYKPKGQDFYVIFGGETPLTFYKSNLELETSDSLINLKQMFMELLDHLNHKDLKPYLIATKNLY